MARVLGDRLNSLVYPDWAASQEKDVRSACSQPDSQITVAVDGITLLGFATVVIYGSSKIGEVDMIAVDPAAQRKGVARALTDNALAQMREAGCRLAVVATGGDDGHAPARALYESAGFTALPLVRYYREL
jgi:ribosomal protein S18 acetylase RimI-like enzyme